MSGTVAWENSGIPFSFLGLRRDRKWHTRMVGLRQDREEDVPKCSGWEISQIFPGKIRFPGNGIWECRPLMQLHLFNIEAFMANKKYNYFKFF